MNTIFDIRRIKITSNFSQIEIIKTYSTEIDCIPSP